MRRLRYIWTVSSKIGWRDEPLKAFRVSVRSAIALIHIAAADPFGAWRYANLIAAAVITGHRAHRMGAVALIVARHY